jgi:hypothetical protein
MKANMTRKSKIIIYLLLFLNLFSCKAQESIKEQNASKLYEALDRYIEKYMSNDSKYLIIDQWNSFDKCNSGIANFFTIHEIKILDNVAEHDYRTFDYKDKIR